MLRMNFAEKLSDRLTRLPGQHFRISFAACLLIAVVVVLPGCGTGSSGPKTVNVSGTIYLDNKPLEDAMVTFASEGFAGTGRTNSEGKYVLAQGAVVGKNTVTVSKWEGGDEYEVNPEEGMDEGQFEAMGGGPPESGAANNLELGPKQLIPEHYSDPKKSDLTFEVPADGTNSADFRLQSK